MAGSEDPRAAEWQARYGKISEALLDFARPLIELLGVEDDERILPALLRIATLAWNAEVLREQRGHPDYRAQAREALKGLPKLQREHGRSTRTPSTSRTTNRLLRQLGRWQA